MSTVVGSGFVEMALDNSRLHRDLQQMKSQVAAAVAGTSKAASATAAGVTASQRTMFQSMAAGAAKAGTAISKLGGHMNNMGRTMMFSGRAVTAFFSLPLLAAGAAAVKAAMGLDEVLTRIKALSNVEPGQVDAWREDLLSLSHDTGIAAQELAEGLYFLASAGLKADDIFPALEASARGAAVGLGLTGDIARVVANALNAYAEEGLTAIQVTDTLAAAIKAGTAEPDEFAGALGRILPIAAKAGVSFDEVAASLASLSNIGLDVNEGVTAMRGLLNALYAPGTQAAKTLGEIGISAEEMRSAISEGGLLQALQMLEDATGGNIDVLDDIIPNIRALTGQFGLTGQNAAKVAEIFDQVRDSTGTMGDAFEETAEGKAFKLKQSFNDLKLGLIDLGNTIIPILLNDVLPVVQKIVDGFSGLSDGTKKAIVQIGLLVVALGPLMLLLGGMTRLLSIPLRGIGLLLRGFGLLAPAATGAASAATGAGAAMAPLAGVGFGIAAGLIAAAGAIAYVAVRAAADRNTIAGFVENLADGEANIGEFNKSLNDFDPGTVQGEVDKFIASNTVLASQLLTVKTAFDDTVLAGSGFEARLISIQSVTLAEKQAVALAAAAVLDLGGALDDATLDMVEFHLQNGNAAAALAVLDKAMRSTAVGANMTKAGFKAARKEMGETTREVAGATRAVDNHTGALKRIPPKVSTTVTAPGITTARGHAQKLKGEYEALPPSKSTQINQPGMVAARSNAQKLKGEYEALPPSKSTTVLTPGAAAALAILHAINAASLSVTKTVTTYYSTSYGKPLPNAEGGVVGAAGGALVGAASGFITKKPQLLVGEGDYLTPFNRGSEAILPLNDQVMGRLGAAIIAGMGGGGSGREAHFHFHQEMPPVHEIVRLVSRELARSG